MICILFILIFLFQIPTFAQEADRSTAISQELAKLEDKTPGSVWEKSHAQQPYLVLTSEYDTKVHEDGSYEENYHTRVKIQSEDAKKLAQWPIFYNKSREEITSIAALVETPQGRRVEAVKTQDSAVAPEYPLYQDMRVKLINLPEVAVGAVIDVRVVTKAKSKQIPGQFYANVEYPSLPTKYSRHTFTVPDNKGIQFKGYKNTIEPVTEKQNGAIKYSFVQAQTDFTSDDDFMPPSEQVQGMLTLSSLSDWKQVSDWYRDVIKKYTTEDAAIFTQAIELTKGLNSQKEKTLAILEFIQDHFHFVPTTMGDHSVDPHSTVDIFKAGYGNALDLSMLARQMLKMAGIEANIALFSGEFNGNPQHGLPNPSAFDHVVLQASIDGQKYFIDTQAKGFDIGQLPSDYDNGHAFVIDDASYHFEDLPISSESMHALITTSDITLTDDGAATFDVHVQMPIEASQNFKQTWKSATKEEKENFFQNFQQNFVQGAKIVDKSIKGVNERYGGVEVSLKYQAEGAYPIVNDMILLKEDQPANMPDFAEGARRYPLFMPNNSVIQTHNVYHIPSGLKIDFVPESFDLNMDFAEASSHYSKKDDQTIAVESLYRMKRMTLPGERYPELVNFKKDLYKKADQYIVLKKKSHVSEEAKDWIKKQ